MRKEVAGDSISGDEVLNKLLLKGNVFLYVLQSATGKGKRVCFPIKILQVCRSMKFLQYDVIISEIKWGDCTKGKLTFLHETCGLDYSNSLYSGLTPGFDTRQDPLWQHSGYLQLWQSSYQSNFSLSVLQCVLLFFISATSCTAPLIKKEKNISVVYVVRCLSYFDIHSSCFGAFTGTCLLVVTWVHIPCIRKLVVTSFLEQWGEHGLMDVCSHTKQSWLKMCFNASYDSPCNETADF